MLSASQLLSMQATAAQALPDSGTILPRIRNRKAERRRLKQVARAYGSRV
jgi:hypothetical protein